ncbi:MAG: GNAT family N-acetyltransferase [Pseudomonadota bacterium]
MVEVEQVRVYSSDVLVALNGLLPQLSSNFGPLSEADLRQIIQSDASTLYMAHDSHEYIGALTLVIFKVPSGLRAWIEDVVVAEQARGAGVGALLVNHAVEVATGMGVKSIDLTSRSTRAPAIALYRKLGFKDRETNVFRYTGDNVGE